VHHLTLRYESKRHLESCLLDDQSFGGLFHATETEIDLGETVLVTICVPQIPEGVTLISRVVWRRRPTKWRSSLLPGIGLGFAAASAPQLEFLTQCLAGSRPPTRRSWPRWPLEIPAEVSVSGDRFLSCTRNIGLGGMFLHSDAAFAAGTEVAVDLYPGGPDEGITFRGKVAWCLAQASDPGFGLAFPRTDTNQRRVAGTIIHRDKLVPLDPPPADRGRQHTTQRLVRR
jgi:Tfp pilus assembly protein PilZ